MYHPIYKIVKIISVRPYMIEILFDDGTKKSIDLEPVLYGEMYGALKNKALFEKVELDPQVGTIQWPNGADFDPAILYHWEDNVNELARRAREWELV